MNKKIVNIVNFVRGCEPRKYIDLYTPVVEEIRIGEEFGLKQTFLLQYDAMIRDDFKELFIKNNNPLIKLGLWFEMNRILAEKLGIPWNGRPGFDWDWYVNPGFLPAYTISQRERIIDEVFETFFATFGYMPKVAGSWLLDAHSMAYMSDKYNVEAFCICREQFAVDAYTLWGGYYNGAYYPSRKNMLCPAQSEENTIKTPVFRMLGIDPIYGYDEKKYNPSLTGCYTMEPVWEGGKNSEIMDWFFSEYYGNPCVSLAHCTTGQENSFGWDKIRDGFILQLEKLKKLQDKNIISIEFLEESGRDFIDTYRETPPSALSALSDWSKNGHQSVWYSSKYYRANLFLDKDKLIFRDIHKFEDNYPETYLETSCLTWNARYENLPVVDSRLWTTENVACELSFSKKVKNISLRENDLKLFADIDFYDGSCGFVMFTENGITISGCDLCFVLGNPDSNISIENNKIAYSRNGYEYAVEIKGRLEVNGVICKINEVNGNIVLKMI